MDRRPWSLVHAQVHRQVKARQLFPPAASILVAVSGGQDSIALLKLLQDLQPKWHWSLQVAHCDHRWRPDSQANAAFVQDLCHQWHLPCRVAIADRVTKTEAEARQWRYATLGALAQENHCTSIATGHTASDRAETLLYNLVRGGGSDGLQALAWQRPLNPQKAEIGLVRPLLGLTRQQTAEFCQRFRLPIWADSTNQDLAYARNRLRLEVMPYLRDHFNPQVDRTLAQTAELLAAEVDYLDQSAQALYATVVQGGSETSPWRIHRLPLKTAHPALQRRVLRRVLQQVMATQVSFEAVEKLVALIEAPNRHQTDPFAGGWVALVEVDWIVLPC
ncbi:MAG TPA: tRNA lysidine(34) synthetase TilS [Leptolyngbyaceae cyanobacterium M65_K2018_010]|nr:tRNA lysidine(34) synthetase TilS [Leptolyngbyaceae cyanobacterium M65_K2018_010]